MFSGVVNYGLGHNSLHKKWQALCVHVSNAREDADARYYFCGSVTIAWSFVIYFFLPNSPTDPGRFFNEQERRVLLRRFEENPFGKDRQPFSRKQFIEALLDYKTYLYLTMGSAIYVGSLAHIRTILITAM